MEMPLRRKAPISTPIVSSHETFEEIPHLAKAQSGSMRSFGGSHGNLQSASSFDSWDRHQMAQQRGSMDNVSIASDAADWKVIGGRRFQAAQPRKSTDEILEHMRTRGTAMSREQSFMSDSEMYEPRKSLSRSSLIGCGSKAATPTPRATPKQSGRRTLRSRDKQQPPMLVDTQGTNISESSVASGIFPPGPILAFQLPRIDPSTMAGGEQYVVSQGSAAGKMLYTDTDLDQYMASIERHRAGPVRASQQLSFALLPTLRQLDKRGEPMTHRSTRNMQAYKQREIERISGSNQDIYSSLTGTSPVRRDMSERTRRALRHIVRKY